MNIIKILIAPDSFKESLSAVNVAKYLEVGLKKANSDFDIVKLPMADGGEGTVRSLIAATNGNLVKEKVKGPLANEVEAFYGILGNGKTAVIEMAAASGLPLVPVKKRNPGKTTTYGTGELIKSALERGIEKIIIGIGGSATNDCGVGMAQALGAKILNSKGQQISFGGENLSKIKRIDLSSLDNRIEDVEIKIACDVDNPLYGKNGAAYVYAPQKGATKEQVKKLDKGLHHISEIIRRDLLKNVSKIPGAGAAGGLGAGLMAFLDAKLRPGIEIVIEASKIRDKLEDIDLVITGEGKIDSQTIAGKTPIGVAKVAKEKDISVIGIAGTIGSEAEKIYDHGIDVFFSIIDSPITLDEAIDRTSDLLISTGENIGRFINIKF